MKRNLTGFTARGSVFWRCAQETVGGLEGREDCAAERVTIGNAAADQLRGLAFAFGQNADHDDVGIERANRFYSHQLEHVLVPRELGQCLQCRFNGQAEVRKGAGYALGPAHETLGGLPLQSHCRRTESGRQLAKIELCEAESIRVRQGDSFRRPGVVVRSAAGHGRSGHRVGTGVTERAVAKRPKAGAGNRTHCQPASDGLKWQAW